MKICGNYVCNTKGYNLSTSLFATVLLCLLIKSNVAQIPIPCVANVTSEGKVCCPHSAQNGLRCGGVERGECGLLRVFNERVPSQILQDDRLGWPIKFFHYMCQCKANFFGIACEQCKFGWEGKNCDIPKIYVRRNIFSYSRKEAEMFRKVVALSDKLPSEFALILEKDTIHSDPLYKPTFINTTIHKYITAMHRYASRATLFHNRQKCDEFGRGVDYNHSVSMFAIWHRYFMLVWERALRKIALEVFNYKDFALPYWDWVDATRCEVCSNEFVGAPGKILPNGIQLIDKHSPFHKFIEYCQPPRNKSCFGCHARDNFEPLNRMWTATLFPTTEEFKFIMSKKKFFIHHEGDKCVSFHKAFEGFCGPTEKSQYLWMHNRVHNMVDGSFCCSATASNDPLFILHHSQVDRILQVWYNKYKPDRNLDLPTYGVKPGQARDDNLVGLLPPVTNRDLFVDIRKLGYSYDSYDFGKHNLHYTMSM